VAGLRGERAPPIVLHDVERFNFDGTRDDRVFANSA